MICSGAYLGVIEIVRCVDHPNVLQIVEEDDRAELPLIGLRCRRQHHVELSGGRSLQQNSVLIHHPPKEPGTIETLHATGPPNVGTAEMFFDRRSQALEEACRVWQ